MNLIDLLVAGKKVNNYEADATGGTLWVDTTHFKCVVPLGRRWFVLGGIINRSDSGTAITRYYDAADKVLYQADFLNAATGVSAWPNTVASTGVGNVAPWFILDEGEYVETLYGAAQGATAYQSCVVIEVMYEP